MSPFVAISACMQRLLHEEFESAKNELLKKLPSVFFRKDLSEKLDDLQEKYSFSDSVKYRLSELARKLQVQWNGKSLHSFYSTQKGLVNELDFLAALTSQKYSYLSHLSAIYFHGLIDQRPKDHFISREIKGKQVTHPPAPLDKFKIRQAFLKPARITNNFFSYGKTTFYLLEKAWLTETGVEKKELRHAGSSHLLRLTTLERTFIDSVISPQYSGGVAAVGSVFSSTRMNLNILKAVYDRIDPIYPYWQVIGFLLEKNGLEKDSALWEEKFSKTTKVPFFVEHGAKSSWVYSENWQVYYPPGAFP